MFDSTAPFTTPFLSAGGSDRLAAFQADTAEIDEAFWASDTGDSANTDDTPRQATG